MPVLTLYFQGMDMTSLSSSVFSTNQNLRSISLGHNQLTEIPSGLFDGLSSLGEVRLYNTEVSCTCESLWFMAHAIDNYISLHGDVICNNGDYAGKYDTVTVSRFFISF